MSPQDLLHLGRCVELAAEAVARGDHPFGSVLVGGDGSVLAERGNEVVTSGDVTAHPELALASWASRHLDPEERSSATMYTSGEHCPMCAAAHVWAGIGRLVYVLSSPTIASLLASGPTLRIRAAEVVAASDVAVQVDGPCPQLEAQAAALFSR